MRMPIEAHTSRPWLIHEIAPDFRIEDVWSFRTPGAGPDDFPVMLAALEASNRPGKTTWPTRFLFAVRWKLGAVFGWDKPQAGLDAAVTSLRDRLPEDLRRCPGHKDPNIPFTPVYQTHDECVEEMANSTAHIVCHLGWVATDDGGYELRMAALTKPGGRLGRFYLAFIKPFRYLVIYPALTRRWERAWLDRDRDLDKKVHHDRES
ncbi:DUF2867 domain-containing protein [Streptomyces sp. CBMA152]|uniref:DUF2867 domain-containing protein n=1 Tax=Streptomyces sp. CBMA152 TaxID=1896312 RepID=UPI00166118D0|nr:DUF2867 domain-containing protein [Streptomyces sp. CBMA152]MBD0744164.1 hypothetical protein [Streptomyces sp. CBMA152]